MAHLLTQALDDFVSHFLTLCQEQGFPSAEFESAWPSPCYRQTGQPGDLLTWQPVRQDEERRPGEDMFARLAQALEVELHPDLITFYSRYWSDPLPAQAPDGELLLLQVWNEEDLERLRGNLIGHALDKQRRRLPLTWFVAIAQPDDDLVISLNNDDGSIWLEKPGKAPHYRLADSLADFIRDLTPLAL